jgi:hypothetical protein
MNEKGFSDEDLSPAEKLRRDLEKMESNEQEIFHTFLNHAEDYQRALGLNGQRLELLERKQPRAGGIYPTAEDWYETALTKIDIDGKNFGIVAKNVCIHPYGNFSASEGWRNLLMAVAQDNSLNNSEGGERLGSRLFRKNGMIESLVI